MRNLLVSVLMLILTIWASEGYSLEENTHKAINEEIAQKGINGFFLNNYLKNNLGFSKGIQELIYGHSEIKRKYDRQEVFIWLGEGGVLEDRPGEWYDYVLGKPTRSINHFHNPLKSSEEWEDAGLNDTVLGISYTGQSQVLWAQNPTQDIGGKWSWKDARRYFYIALTGRDIDGREIARTKQERDSYYAYTFRAMGQLMHLVQDASVPEHVRNDIHLLPAYEAKIEEFRTRKEKYDYLWDRLLKNPITFDESILNISSTNPSAPVPISRIVDTDRYTGSNPDITKTIYVDLEPAQQTIGISEYTNANFLSKDTMFESDTLHNFPFPRTIDTIIWTDSNNRKYFRKTGSGDTINHLAITSLMYFYRWRYFPQYEEYLPVSLDDECYKDYASLLIPRAVGYSAGLLNYFFRGDLEESYIKEQKDAAGNITGITIRVTNLTVDETMQGNLMVAYRYKLRGETEYTYGLSNIITNIVLPYLGKETYTFNFPFPISSIASEKQFTLVFRGTLGKEEGAVIGKVIGMMTGTVGLINTSGGDSYGLSLAGKGGNVTIQADAVIQPVNATGSLIVPAGTIVALSGIHEYVTIQIDGTVQATGSLTLRTSNGFFLNEGGLIRVENGKNGGTLIVESEWIVKLDGVIDTSGKNADSEGGGNGGDVTIKTSYPILLQVPTIVTRGGDADEAAIHRDQILSKGGRGGDVTITSINADIILAGGPPPIDTLPLPPPYNLGSFGKTKPDPGERVALNKAIYNSGEQIGFNRGILTSGGMGGSGLLDNCSNNNGGEGGDGGDIFISTQNGIITFKDIDIITGADVETVVSTIFIPETGVQNIYYASTGSLGGKGVSGGCESSGNGGNGGNAGSITVLGTIQPVPARFFNVGGPDNNGYIIGFNDGQRRPYWTDYYEDFIIGRTVQAESADGSLLYRLRVDFAGNALAGSGGIPGGSVLSGFPGFFGYQGQGGTISGLLPITLN